MGFFQLVQILKSALSSSKERRHISRQNQQSRAEISILAAFFEVFIFEYSNIFHLFIPWKILRALNNI